MTNGWVTLYSFTVECDESKKMVSSFVDMFGIEYSITKSFAKENCFKVTLSGSNSEETEKLILISQFISEQSSHNTADYLNLKKEIIDLWQSKNRD